jgi:small subunit ribosomal protein S8
MAVTDPIADFLTCVRNACKAKHKRVDVPSSRMKTELARVMLQERFINNYKVISDRKQGLLRLYLKYDQQENSVIKGLKKISTPGRRVYATKDKIPRVQGGLGIAIISSSRGLITNKEARKIGCGGEVICYVW